jgi:general stress protein CsbA
MNPKDKYNLVGLLINLGLVLIILSAYLRFVEKVPDRQSRFVVGCGVVSWIAGFASLYIPEKKPKQKRGKSKKSCSGLRN